MSFLYEGTVNRVRLISRFPKEALSKINPHAEWAAQLLLVSRWFVPEPQESLSWQRCCDIDAPVDDPNIYIEVVVGGIGPVTLKNPNSKDIYTARLLLTNTLDQNSSISYNIEEPAPYRVIYQCADIYTKTMKGKPHLRRHLHIEKGGRLLWNLSQGKFVDKLETNETLENLITTAPVVNKDELFVSH